MPDTITPEMFEKLANLAALELDHSESEYLRTELNHQLAAVKELSEIQLDDSVVPSLHGINCQGKPPREDVWKPFQNPEEIIALAPESEDGMVAVPDVARADQEGK
ncbi:MAG: Asp-tRNA(Asn)/Glu-tRNA(Gln) amidotransferase subunit GatC [Anaerolineaceae bacterium]